MASGPGRSSVLHRSMRTQENHEVRFPVSSMPQQRHPAHTASRTKSLCGTKIGGQLSGPFKFTTRSVIMTWETPAAAEIRFGFEITMYVANR
jgi:coenzyme PQQ precursor peptide PqqA